MKVSKVDIKVVNWCKTVEMSKGSRSSRPILQHYVDVMLLLQPFFEIYKGHVMHMGGLFEGNGFEILSARSLVVIRNDTSSVCHLPSYSSFL
jgi:hypothetical protein